MTKTHPRYVLSRLASVSWEGGKGVLLSPAARRSIEFDDERVLRLVHRFAAPARVDEAAPSAEERRWVALLARAGVLVPVVRGRPREPTSLAVWERHDSAFHLASRVGAGATYRLEGRRPPPPLLKPTMSRAAVALPRPPGDEAPRSFWSVLAERRSTRAFGREPLALERLAALLYHAASNRQSARDDHGCELGRRAYPSGGALYPLEIYPLVPRGACAGLAGGLYHYRPGDHRLEPLGPGGRVGGAMLRSARRSAQVEGRAWVLLNVTARIARTAWKYEGIAYSLILKEVGCLLQTVYLAGTALGLGVCAVGLGPIDALANLAGLDPADEPLVGEIIVGAPGPPADAHQGTRGPAAPAGPSHAEKMRAPARPR